MSKQDMIRMAREAGFEADENDVWITDGYWLKELERFAILVAIQERERAALKVEELGMIGKGKDYKAPNLRGVCMNYEVEIKRLNEKIEFLARTNMLYSDWEHRDTQVTSDLIRKGIDASRLNVELLSALVACLDWMEQLRGSGDAGNWEWQDDAYTKGRAVEAKLKEKGV